MDISDRLEVRLWSADGLPLVDGGNLQRYLCVKRLTARGFEVSWDAPAVRRFCENQTSLEISAAFHEAKLVAWPDWGA